MSTPLIQDPLLIQEIDRLFKLDYGNKRSSDTTQDGSVEIDDPREIDFHDIHIDSFRDQRERIRKL